MLEITVGTLVIIVGGSFGVGGLLGISIVMIYLLSRKD
jgi:hypothetical protein